MYPYLRVVNLHPEDHTRTSPLSAQQLEQLLSCCPAVQDLEFIMCEDQCHTALLRLLQLSALTRLALHGYVPGTESVAAAAAQLTGLTGLKHFEWWDLRRLTGTALLQLTALRSLEAVLLEAQFDLTAGSNGEFPSGCLQLRNKVSLRALMMHARARGWQKPGLRGQHNIMVPDVAGTASGLVQQHTQELASNCCTHVAMTLALNLIWCVVGYSLHHVSLTIREAL